jgi:aryl-alcohol dehydrogenase-like predicted oxidoreductase
VTARDQGMALVPWSPLKNGFLSGKYRRGAQVTDSARAAFVGGPGEDEYTVIDAVAAVADELGTASAAVSLAWPLAREGTIVPILGARRRCTARCGRCCSSRAPPSTGESSGVYPPLAQSDVRY